MERRGRQRKKITYTSSRRKMWNEDNKEGSLEIKVDENRQKEFCQLHLEF